MDYVANLCLLLPHCSSLTDTLFNKNWQKFGIFSPFHRGCLDLVGCFSGHFLLFKNQIWKERHDHIIYLSIFYLLTLWKKMTSFRALYSECNIF